MDSFVKHLSVVFRFTRWANTCSRIKSSRSFL